MKRTIIFLALLAAMGIVVLAGCQSAAFQAGDRTGQGLKAEYTSTGGPGYLIITHRDGRIEIVPLPGKEVSYEK